MPDNELTRTFFPSLVGKSIKAFLNHVNEEYRLPVAHMNLDAYDRMILDPADVRVDHRIDYTNAVLLSLVRDMIVDEWRLMCTVDGGESAGAPEGLADG